MGVLADPSRCLYPGVACVCYGNIGPILWGSADREGDRLDWLEFGLTMVSYFTTGLLGGLFSIWVAKKIMLSRENIMEAVDSVLEYALNTVEGQMKIKAVMEKLGEGLMKGTGLAGLTGRSGKIPKLTDIIIQIALGYAQKQGLLNFGAEQPQNQQQERKDYQEFK